MLSQTPKDYIALYKGLPDEFLHKVMHYVTCFFLSVRKLRLIKYSHAELCLNGVCYSSSVRDAGVRSKLVDLNSGKWDLIELNLSETSKQIALDRFFSIDGKSYDFLGAVGVVLPFVQDSRDKYFCFEVVATMLGIPNQGKVTPIELERFNRV